MRGSNSGGYKRFLSSPKRPDRLFRLLLNGHRGTWPAVKRPGRDADNSLSSGTQFKGEQKCTSYLLNPRCRIILEKLTGLQLVKKFPAFRGTRRYRTHKRPPPVSILGQPNPVHIPTSHLLEIQPNIIHPSTPRSPQCTSALLICLHGVGRDNYHVAMVISIIPGTGLIRLPATLNGQSL